MKRRLPLFIILGIVTTSIAPLASLAAPQRNSHQRARASKLSASLAASSSSETARVIIQTQSVPSAGYDAAIQATGGRKRESFDRLNMIVADVPRNALADLASRTDVKYISEDRAVHANLDLVTESTGAAQVQTGSAGAPAVKGKGITIAILDSGISASHPDFAGNNRSRIVAAVDFTDSNVPGDPYGHGTGVAGMAAGDGAASSGYQANYAGSAPGANLADVRVLNSNGVGRISNVIAGLNWIIQNRDRYNIRVANMSLGAPPEESFHLDPVCNAVEAAVLANIVVVVSAGNRGRTEEIIGQNADGSPIYRSAYGGINSPGNSPYAITVGATDVHSTVKRSDDTIASFSSKGPTSFDRQIKPDIVAPGRRVIAPMSQEWNAGLPIQFPEKIVQPASSGATSNAYFTYSGTSFAAPVVAGTVALMLEANRSLTPLLVKAILTRTAQPLSGFANKAQSVLSQGAGLVNAAAAVEMSRAAVPNANKLAAGDRLFNGNTTLSSLSAFTIGGERIAPSNRVLYANGVLFSQRPLLTNGIALDEGIIISDGIILADGIIAGDGIMIGDGHLLSDGVVVGEGIIIGDSVVHGAGIIIADAWFLNQTVRLADGLARGDGVVVGEGHLLTDGVVVGEGHLLTDGVVVGEGHLLTDGVVNGDSSIAGNGIILSDGHLLSDGIALGDGVVVGEGHLLTDGVVVGEGHLLTDGVVVGDGHLLSDGVVVGEGVVNGDGVVVGEGHLLTDGVVVGEGIIIVD